MDTVASEASIFAIRDWLDLNCFARPSCVSRRERRRSLIPLANASLISIRAASSSLSPRTPWEFRDSTRLSQAIAPSLDSSASPHFVIGSKACPRASPWRRFGTCVDRLLPAVAAGQQYYDGLPIRGANTRRPRPDLFTRLLTELPSNRSLTQIGGHPEAG